MLADMGQRLFVAELPVSLDELPIKDLHVMGFAVAATPLNGNATTCEIEVLNFIGHQLIKQDAFLF